MFKRFLIGILFLCLITSFFYGKSSKDAENFSNEYSKILDDYKKKIKTVKTREAYDTLIKNTKKELENILIKYKNSPESDELELLKSKVLIDLFKLKEAEEKVNKLITKKSKLIHDAKMVKVQIFIYKKKINDAHAIFAPIEGKVKRGKNYFNTLLYFALYLKDINLREKYANRFLNAKDLPEELSDLKANAYQSLSMIAIERKNLGKAKEMLQKAISLTKNPRMKQSLESELEQLKFLGKPAPSISADVWINSRSMTLESLKGKVVVVDFWATWCNPCRTVIPVLADIYKKYKNKGLVVIGFTKLYGRYRDEKETRASVTKDEEVSLIKKFSERHQINYPVAISFEGKDFETYKISGIPSMIFINKNGNIEYIKIGAGQPQFIRDKIEELLGIK